MRSMIRRVSFKELQTTIKNPFRLGREKELCVQGEACRTGGASPRSRGAHTCPPAAQEVLRAVPGLAAVSFLLAR